MTTATEPKKFSIEYQIEDDNGAPIGPPQHFEADTQKELLDMVKNAHRSAAKEMYKEKKARKIGDMITPDPDQPIQRFERKILSADDRTKLAAALKDPQTGPEAVRTLLEAELGAPVDSVREALQYVEVRKRIDMANLETDKFLGAHSEYVQCDSNEDLIKRWLNKRNLAITHKNLELAYEDLGDMVTKSAPKRPEPTQEVSVVATPTEPVVPAPPQPEAIPLAATPAPAITEQPAEVLIPKQSSSGLSRDNSGTPPPAAPKAKEIPYAQLARMNSGQYQAWLNDPANRELVKQMDKK
jgi:hypothetical protein